MASYYKLGSSVEVVQPEDGKKFSLEEAQKLVGGYVELVRLDADNILLCDEEGLMKQKPINMAASKVAKDNGWRGEFIVGDVLFLREEEF